MKPKHQHTTPLLVGKGQVQHLVPLETFDESQLQKLKVRVGRQGTRETYGGRQLLAG